VQSHKDQNKKGRKIIMEKIKYLKRVLGGALISLFLIVGIGCTSATESGAVHWTYDEVATWGDLSTDYATCKSGTEQSPIDLKTTSAAGGLSAISFSYVAAADLVITNNGHTVQVDYPAGSKITVDGTSYDLVQFHFHAPSENTIDGQAKLMELHFVHKDTNGNLAVVGVLIEAGTTAHAALDTILNNATTTEGTTTFTGTAIDANSFLPSDKSYYAFKGSLTTPPCTEGVVWRVLTNTISATTAQKDAFQSKIGGHANARPVQTLGSRTVTKN
jgi:carbonic anhydrase